MYNIKTRVMLRECIAAGRLEIGLMVVAVALGRRSVFFYPFDHSLQPRDGTRGDGRGESPRESRKNERA